MMPSREQSLLMTMLWLSYTHFDQPLPPLIAKPSSSS